MKSSVMRMREQIFCICADFGLTRGERIEVASYVLGQEIETFNQLGPFELARVLDAFEGAKYVASVKMDYKSGARTRSR